MRPSGVTVVLFILFAVAFAVSVQAVAEWFL